MQSDMHYYGTYAMARAAGLRVKDAGIVAYAAQYVDDSTANDSEVHTDGGMFETTATAHTNRDAIKNAAINHTEQRRVWVPFHFFPGNEGNTVSEKLTCVKDGPLAREMVQNHIQHAISVKDDYGLALMGVMAHVYADTFAHYGFSGVSSRNNEVDGESFELDVKDKAVKAYVMDKMSMFLAKYTPSFIIKNYRKIVNQAGEDLTGALGHGGVGTYPDRPFLKWRFNYEKDNRDSGWRDNPATFIQACEKLHAAFRAYAEGVGICHQPVEFDSIKNKVDNILRLERGKEGRTSAWIEAINNNELFQTDESEMLFYSDSLWEAQKKNFMNLNNSCEARQLDVYKFHLAAIYHRNYTLKDLLPKHGLVIL